MKYVQKIRRYELSLVIPLIPKGSNILEIGAGAGWQAKILTEHGFAVKAIDLEESRYAKHRVWPVLHYDGQNIPFPDNHFDVVFSSSVLEHIAHVEQFQSEIKRVLKKNGQAIHILPSGSWRIWTSMSHYLFIVKALLFKLFPNLWDEGDSMGETIQAAHNYSKKELLKKALYPSRHGEAGNVISEIYLFSRLRWTKLFNRTGWNVQDFFPNRLFYTGSQIFSSRLSIKIRKKMSYLFGSSCLIYVLKKYESKNDGFPER
jgi:ubiquinone/menaquinone biosynthesis C-methylase UbiE